MTNHRRAFTMIELLFVVATIAVLAAISVPNFLEAQIRSKIARTKANNAVIAMGLSRYYAEHAAYPPNSPEARRYLAAAMDNPVMNEESTSQPADVKVGWFKHEVPSRGPWTTNVYTRASFPPLLENGLQLSALTTPVAYLESSVPSDVFDIGRGSNPFYLNSYELFSADDSTSHPGLWGDHLTSQTYVVTGSAGPNNQFDFWHPLSGPWISYDATNGTASDGDFLDFQGRRPGFVAPDAALNPEDKSMFTGLAPGDML